jgi:hypothetical protein
MFLSCWHSQQGDIRLTVKERGLGRVFCYYGLNLECEVENSYVRT